MVLGHGPLPYCGLLKGAWEIDSEMAHWHGCPICAGGWRDTSVLHYVDLS